jgi:hypothetical protein
MRIIGLTMPTGMWSGRAGITHPIGQPMLDNIGGKGDLPMIGCALERGSLIVVFDLTGRTLFAKARGSGPKDGLLGFTGSTVTARYGSIIYTYDERGMTIYAKAA